ncbi:hypothetical protein AWQ21_11820 [Picosynechococcus sp. PCC 7003]|uniref:YadA-like family protein n=1 Tax=Picosynechococcus sp. PCC 7003 TaxID=374981 RepID=UPI000810B556|nr:YadA-like family protein [Picosynechococcus sp. PCC 7003]ANV85001.1 hypothetical protein AWQ21_11820 [Picosynechococcus sp. PCC 7003]
MKIKNYSLVFNNILGLAVLLSGWSFASPRAAAQACPAQAIDGVTVISTVSFSFQTGLNITTTEVATEGSTQTAVDNLVSCNNVNSTNIVSNATDIATNSTNIVSNATDIATNSTNIVSNATDIATNSTNIVSNATDIATNSTNIVSNATDIATNSTNIVSNATDIATNSTNIVSNATDIATNSTNIVSNATDIATNSTNIVSNATDIADLKQDVKELRAGVASVIAMDNAEPELRPGHRFGIGVGFGTFQDETALGAAAKFLFTDPNSTGTAVTFKGSAGWGLNEDTFSAGAGIGISF